VFGYKSLRKLIIPLMLLNFAINYIFYSPSAINSSTTNDLFTESIIEGISYSVAVIPIHFFLEHVTRRSTNFFISTATFVLLIFLILEDSNPQSLLHSITYFVYRLVVSMGFLSVYLINYESFPTQIRAVGATFAYLFGNTCGIIQPHLGILLDKLGWNVLYSFLVIAALGSIPNIFLK
jgi:hypothetical protein